MSPRQRTGKAARARRREDFWNRVTLLVGCAAIVGIVASVIAVASQEVMRSAPVMDESYLQAQIQERTWSGKTKSEPAQFDAGRSHVAEPATTPPKAEPLKSGIEEIESKRALIEHTVKSFFAATTVDARLPYVRDAERVRPLMQEYYGREPAPELQWRGLGRVVRVDEPGYRFGYAQAQFDNAAAVTVIVEEMEDGRFCLDWECLVRYGEMDWQEFLGSHPGEAKLMRVKASRAKAPPGESQDLEWLELRHSLKPGTVLAFFRGDDPALVSVARQLEQGNGADVPLTLRLSFPPARAGSGGGYAMISGVEGKGWLILGQGR